MLIENSFLYVEIHVTQNTSSISQMDISQEFVKATRMRYILQERVNSHNNEAFITYHYPWDQL